METLYFQLLNPFMSFGFQNIQLLDNLCFSSSTFQGIASILIQIFVSSSFEKLFPEGTSQRLSPSVLKSSSSSSSSSESANTLLGDFFSLLKQEYTYLLLKQHIYTQNTYTKLKILTGRIYTFEGCQSAPAGVVYHRLHLT